MLLSHRQKRFNHTDLATGTKQTLCQSGSVHANCCMLIQASGGELCTIPCITIEPRLRIEIITTSFSPVANLRVKHSDYSSPMLFHILLTSHPRPLAYQYALLVRYLVNIPPHSSFPSRNSFSIHLSKTSITKLHH